MSDAVTPKAVLSARQWLGTPYLHQASCKHYGTDCLGLIRGVWRDLCGPEPFVVPQYTFDWSEANGNEVLWKEAMRLLVPNGSIDVIEPGDVLLFRMRKGAVAKHLGIAAQSGRKTTFIHAYSKRGVVETSLSDAWKRCVVATFKFPD